MDTNAPSSQNKRIVITGATGLIGTALTERLIEHNYRIIVLSRHPASAQRRLPGAEQYLLWSPGVTGDWRQAIDGADAVIHLAGESLFGSRWTNAFKQRIRESRIQGTRSIVQAIHDAGTPPSLLVSSSAVGFYGDTGNTPVGEHSSSGTGFLAELCEAWENEAYSAQSDRTRVVTLRTGLVLAANGGSLPKMLPAFKLGLGAWFGNGNQRFPWVHIDDVTGLIEHLLHHTSASGPMNAVAPGIVTNKEFSKALGNALRRPVLLPVPGWVLRLALGEFASALLTGQNAAPTRTIETGYTFKYPALAPALKHLVSIR